MGGKFLRWSQRGVFVQIVECNIPLESGESELSIFAVNFIQVLTGSSYMSFSNFEDIMVRCEN